MRIKDVDFNSNHIVERAGKEDNDRVMLVPVAVERVRKLHKEDLEAGDLRPSFATHLMEAGHDIRKIQELLGVAT